MDVKKRFFKKGDIPIHVIIIFLVVLLLFIYFIYTWLMKGREIGGATPIGIAPLGFIWYFRPRLKKKAQKPILGTLGKLIIGLALAAVLLFIVVPLISNLLGTESIELPECTEYDEGRSISSFENSIKKYSMTPTTQNPNPNYDPEEAVVQFKKYLACKQAEKLLVDEAKHKEMLNLGKSVFIKRAEEICSKYNAANTANDKNEMEYQKEDYFNLADEYAGLFEDQELSKPSGCKIS